MKNIITDGTRCVFCERNGVDEAAVTVCAECGQPACIAHSIATGRRRGAPRICADCIMPADSDGDNGYDYDFLADARIGDLSDIEAGDELYARM
ncbi:DUF2180 family protein [Bifidobacterium myosotis]|uniref:DUF2180 family protein n=1 Tax=Bifidobacterium myosotis TaxID=1630166 RepID=A0A5M9ZKM8_9BIFI|nr:DUF2180 family protein [Bifidobacterium myosotis]KAA8828124.1 DUF2180 family protein [Bifidobacterium myosotis]